MILSRTLEGPPNLSSMTLEVLKVSPSYDPIGLFEDLKKTPLYDTERGQWQLSMEAAEKDVTTERYTHDQVLAIIVLSELGQCSIKESYEKLKDTQFYNKVQKNWHNSITVSQSASSLNCTITFLTEVLLLSKFDKEAAKDAYETLKNTAFYDQALNQWKPHMNSDLYYSRDQLLGVLIDSEFDLIAGKESYLKLKATSHYDKERKQWNDYITEQQVSPNQHRFIDSQFLDVLIRANFNIEEARHAYEKLKKTVLYDKERQQWSYFMNAEQVVQSTIRTSFSELLAVLIEAKLAEAFPPETSLSENLPALPDIWRAK